MTYGYIRVSTEKQTVENQKIEILKWCNRNGIDDVVFVDETVSGTVKVSQRKLGRLLAECMDGDLMVVTELSRLGRSITMIFDVLQELLERHVRVVAIKEGYELGDNIQSKVLAFAFGLSAEIERNLISERTKQGLARVVSEGKHVGHFKGVRNKNRKLDRHRSYIFRELHKGRSILSLARELGVQWSTMKRYIEDNT